MLAYSDSFVTAQLLLLTILHYTNVWIFFDWNITQSTKNSLYAFSGTIFSHFFFVCAFGFVRTEQSVVITSFEFRLECCINLISTNLCVCLSALSLPILKRADKNHGKCHMEIYILCSFFTTTKNISMIIIKLLVIKVILEKCKLCVTLFHIDKLDIVTPIHIQTMSTTEEKGEHIDENVWRMTDNWNCQFRHNKH